MAMAMAGAGEGDGTGAGTPAGEGAAAAIEDDLPPVIVRARHASRRPGDYYIELFAGLIVAAVRVGLPAGVVYLVTRDRGSAVVAMLMLGAPAALWRARTLEISRQGITARGRFGGAIVVSWAEIVDVRLATPGEVFLRGKLGSLRPRELSHTMAIFGHVHVVHRGGDFYFPPDVGADRFLRLCESRRRGAGEVVA